MPSRRSRFVPLFERSGDDVYRVNLPGSTRELIDDLLAQLSGMLGQGGPALRRLFPKPYGDDEERNAGYAVLAGSELLENRLDAITEMRGSLTERHVDGAQLDTWMRTINDLRLVMGTLLDIRDDENEIPIDDDNEDLFIAYEHLGYVLESIVTALMSD